MGRFLAAVGILFSVIGITFVISFVLNMVFAGIMLYGIDFFLGTSYCTWSYAGALALILTVLRTVFNTSVNVKK